jgi:hypothetical protein
VADDPTSGPPWIEDAGEFASETERVVGRALERLRRDYPPARTLIWIPNPRIRTGTGIVRPDFLIAVGPRWGALEIDGPLHRGKWALDRSKDMRLEDAGAVYVGRIDVAGTNDPQELVEYLRRLVHKIGGTPGGGQIAA